MGREWSRSVAIRPKDNLKTEAGFRAQKFVPSYEKDACEPESIAMLMGNEYQRTWVKERDNFVEQREKAVKPRKIKNDFEWWLKIRKTQKRFCGLS